MSLKRKTQMSKRLDNIAIEVTRKCNMGCAHCLRGNAQNLDIDFGYIDSFLSYVSSIGTITFSGGEPALNVNVIEKTLEYCKEREIEVGGFYIVTNGKENVLELSVAALKWYAYCWEKEMCGLALSKDMFHENIPIENEEILRGLSFFREDKFTDFNRVNLIEEGRAIDLNGIINTKFRDADFHNETVDADLFDDTLEVYSMLYLSADGQVKSNCDSSYDDNRFNLGHIYDKTLDEMIREHVEL